jgi:hypothetical protein
MIVNTELLVVYKVSGLYSSEDSFILFDSRVFCCVLLCIPIRTRIPDTGFQHPPYLVGMFSFGNDVALVSIGGAVEEIMILGLA